MVPFETRTGTQITAILKKKFSRRLLSHRPGGSAHAPRSGAGWGAGHTYRHGLTRFAVLHVYLCKISNTRPTGGKS